MRTKVTEDHGLRPGQLRRLQEAYEMRGMDIFEPVALVQQPWGEVMVADGHHRIELARGLGLKTIPAVLRNTAATSRRDLALHIGDPCWITE